jgi:uncharacterized repeat protein (TIGR03803 family)
MNKPPCWKAAYFVLLLFLATTTSSLAQTFTTVATFNGKNGQNPGYGSLVQGTDGNLYGTTIYGGVSQYCTVQFNMGCGTVFKVTPSGKLTTLHNFCSQANCPDGYNPYAGLIVGIDGSLYGTTEFGGAGRYCMGGCGTVFEITTAGKLTTLYSFGSINEDGNNPLGALVQATNGNFYGTTAGGGVNAGGTVFELTPGGKLSTLYAFCNECGTGVPYAPYAGLVQATNGDFYGTAAAGLPVFQITAGGTLTGFSLSPGYEPVAALIQATNETLYGTTAGLSGTIFEMLPDYAPTTLYTFCQTNCDDGVQPYGGLLQATDGNLYGTTSLDGNGTGCTPNGSNHGCGTVFEITTAGALTTLHNFSVNAGCPVGGLVQATNGRFYGTTGNCGSSTIFSLDTGLGPFVGTIPTAAKSGAKVIILGTDLTSTTSVTFNGTSAVFTVVSSTEIAATVPTGATTGRVEVITPSGTLKSNVVFRVI